MGKRVSESCYQKLGDSIKGELSQVKFEKIVEDLKNRYGEPQGIANLEQPVAQILPGRDEALFERSTEAALKYHSYMARVTSSKLEIFKKNHQNIRVRNSSLAPGGDLVYLVE